MAWPNIGRLGWRLRWLAMKQLSCLNRMLALVVAVVVVGLMRVAMWCPELGPSWLWKAPLLALLLGLGIANRCLQSCILVVIVRCVSI